MSEAIINNASFANNSGSGDLTPITVYSESDLSVGDIVTIKPILVADRTLYNTTSKTDCDISLQCGNILIGYTTSSTGASRAIWSAVSDGSSISSVKSYAMTSSIFGTAGTSLQQIISVFVFDDTHIVVFSARRGEDNYEYDLLYLTMIAVDQSTAALTFVSEYCINSGTIYSNTTSWPSRFIVTNNAIVVKTTATSSNAKIYKVSSYVISLGSTYTLSSAVYVPVKGTAYIYAFVSGSSSCTRYTISSSGTMTTTTYSLGKTIYVSSGYNIGSIIYLNASTSSSAAGFNLMQYLYTSNTLSSTIFSMTDTVFQSDITSHYFDTVDENNCFWIYSYTMISSSSRTYTVAATLVDLNNNTIVGPYTLLFTDEQYASTPIVTQFRSRYSIWNGYIDEYLVDMLNVEKFDMNGIPSGKISAVLGSGKYEMVPLS